MDKGVPRRLEDFQIISDSGGRCRVRCGFELASFSIPSQFDSGNRSVESAQAGSHFPGEEMLGQEIRSAILPFLESIPDGASLVVEYQVVPQANASVQIRMFILVETSVQTQSEALAESVRLMQGLALALSVLSDWYSFRVASFGSSTPVEPIVHVLRVLPGSREVTGQSNVGFMRQKGVAQLLIPAIAPTQPGRSSRPSLLFSAAWSAVVETSLLAARALPQPLKVTLALTRADVSPELNNICAQAKVGSVGKVYEGESGQESLHRQPEQVTQGQELELAADNFLDDLAAQPVALRLNVQVSSGHEIPEVFLRVLGMELFPGAPARIEVVNSMHEGAIHPSEIADVSNLLPYPHWLPPLFPSPPLLERGNFLRHYSNPSIALPSAGLELGRMQCGGMEHPVFIAQADRSRHMYVLGATGTGKSTLIYNMVRQDLEAGRGVALIDPHGDLFEQVLSAVPRDRIDDVVIIDPSDKEHPVGLNPLDLPSDVSPVVLNRTLNALFDMFEQFYDMRVAGGPIFETYFRNLFKLAVAAPKSVYRDHPLSLGSLSRILRDRELLKAILQEFSASDPVRTFFEQAEKTVGEGGFENVVPYITSKLNRLVDNPLISSMLCSPKRTIDFRKVMDEKKILLVNLAKGEIGAQDARLLGMLITNYLFEAALERADSPKEGRVPFYYYLDEFQNFTTSTIADVLAEARKYGLHMILANQTLSQLIGPHLSHPRALVEAVLGNVATKLCMRVGLDDATLLEQHFLPQFNARTLSQLPDRHVACRLLVHGCPSAPFVFSTLPSQSAPVSSENLKERALDSSRRRYSAFRNPS